MSNINVGNYTKLPKEKKKKADKVGLHLCIIASMNFRLFQNSLLWCLAFFIQYKRL